MRAPDWLQEYEGRNGGDARAATRLVASVVAGTVAIAVAGWGIGAVTASEGPACTAVTIQPGDTLAALARAHGHTVDQLAAWNGLADPDYIRAGDDLCIDPPLVHVAAVTARQRATRCTGGPAPGAVAARDAIIGLWPGLVDLGIYNCRDARGGSSHSTHAEGRAIDYGIPACDTGQGQAIARHIADRAEHLGAQRILVCDDEWLVGIGWRPASPRVAALHNGDRAPAHIHLELSRQAADVLTVGHVTAVLQ